MSKYEWDHSIDKKLIHTKWIRDECEKILPVGVSGTHQQYMHADPTVSLCGTLLKTPSQFGSGKKIVTWTRIIFKIRSCGNWQWIIKLLERRLKVKHYTYKNLCDRTALGPQHSVLVSHSWAHCTLWLVPGQEISEKKIVIVAWTWNILQQHGNIKC